MVHTANVQAQLEAQLEQLETTSTTRSTTMVHPANVQAQLEGTSLQGVYKLTVYHLLSALLPRGVNM